MPKKAAGLEQLMAEELQDRYDAEKQLARALPTVAKAASVEDFRKRSANAFDVTKGHVI